MPIKKQCAKMKTSGWNSMLFCMHDQGHKGPCSWEDIPEDPLLDETRLED